ncbi:hypothetical protein ABZ532_16490 [Streptomyces sp. NPDC019396]|uniref:hypothetical protein n=1 Tax=Streptomyces sp. NPDC019396 TaxID=3154687 RepID=UPI0033C751B6
MTEQQDTPDSPAPQQSGPGIPGTPGKPPRGRRRLVVGGTVALALAVLAGGGALALGKLADADRTAPTVVWAQPSAAVRGADSSIAPRGLAAKLPPVPFFSALGPDIDGLGNNVVLGKRQAIAHFKEGSRDLPPTQRKARNKAIDKLRIQGLALRSHVSFDRELIVEMRLAQIENGKDGRALAAFQSEFAEALGIFRKGPAIPGFKNAKCFLMPKGLEGKDSDTELDAMFCSAYEGDVLVDTVAYGTGPLDTKTAADLLEEQLEYLRSPGEYV